MTDWEPCLGITAICHKEQAYQKNNLNISKEGFVQRLAQCRDSRFHWTLSWFKWATWEQLMPSVAGAWDTQHGERLYFSESLCPPPWLQKSASYSSAFLGLQRGGGKPYISFLTARQILHFTVLHVCCKRLKFPSPQTGVPRPGAVVQLGELWAPGVWPQFGKLWAGRSWQLSFCCPSLRSPPLMAPS